MATILETLKAFDKAKIGANVPQADYIRRVLMKESLLNEVDPQDSMILSLPGNEHLTTGQKVTDHDTEVLSQLLIGNTYITHLDLRYNRITDLGARHLARVIKTPGVLVHVNLNGNDIGEAGGQELAHALQDNESIKEFRIRSNKIGNSGGMAFAQMLQVNTTLEILDLADTDLKTEAVIALATVLRSNTTLRHLNMSRPLLFTYQEEPTVHFAKMLQVNTTLKGLSMKKFDMRDFGVGQLTENLLENMCITHLDLSCNRITRDGMEQLVRVLKQNTSIKHLDLSNNRLECPGAKFLATALAHFNTNLISVSVRSNNIKGKGLCHLADAMKYNSTVESLYIWGNVLEESACIAFSRLLQEGRFEEGKVDVKPYEVDGVTYLCEMNTAPNRFDYWKPVYGDDIPDKLV